MISWIQRYFQRHFRTVFLVLLGITIISFIFAFNASSGFGRADRSSVKRPFFQYNLGSAADQQKMFGDAQLSFNLQMGYDQRIQQDSIVNYELQRAAALHMADELHLPAATPEEITESIKKLGVFATSSGEFDPQAYASFRSRLKQGGGLSEADIARVLGDDVRMDKVQKLVGGPGYALPGEIRTQLERADTTWSVNTATVDLASFKPDLKPTEADLQKYFQENALSYEVPAQVVASAINFPAANYVTAVNVTEAEVKSYYDENATKYAAPIDPKNPVPPKPDATVDYAKARSRAEGDLKLDRARQLAIKAASDFAYSLYTTKAVAGPALDASLANQHLARTDLAPFTRDKGPVEFGNSPEISEAAFKLDPAHFYTEALPTPDGATILFWKSVIAARTPQLAEVKEKVATDYITAQRKKQFVALGETLRSQLEARLKSSEPWDKAVAAVAAANNVKIDAKSIPPFTARTRPADLDYSVASSLEKSKIGQVSSLQVSGQKGIFFQVTDKKAPDANAKNPLYTTTQNELAMMSSRVASGALLGEVVERELDRGKVTPR